MPTDNRRITGPDVSSPYFAYLKTTSKNVSEGISKQPFQRRDGRATGDHRKIYMKTGIVSQAKGSAYVELGKTKVMCSVFDPREIPNRLEYSQHGELYCIFKFAPFSCHYRRAHQTDSEEKELSLSLKRALEPAVCRHEFPNFQVDVCTLVLENDGSALAAAITCAGLALADAHVPMYDLVTACTVAVHRDSFLVDPSEEEASMCALDNAGNNSNAGINQGVVTLSLMGAHTQVSQIWQTGSMSASCVGEALEKLIRTCEEIYPLSQRCLVKSVASTISKKDTLDIEHSKR